jgi:uncharacterized membrane protein YhaH (DUF805 family)
MDWYLKVLKQYADFSGRARRKEYWMFALFNLIFGFVAMVLDRQLGLSFNFNWNILGYGWIWLIYCLAVFIPSLAVSVRRLHDIGKSGWMILVWLIPLAGAYWLLILLVTDSDPDDNLYGINPKE